MKTTRAEEEKVRYTPVGKLLPPSALKLAGTFIFSGRWDCQLTWEFIVKI